MGKNNETSSNGSPKRSRSNRASIKHIEFVDFATLNARVAERPKWLVEPLIPLGKSTAVVSEAGIGKSLFMLDIAASLAVGRAILERSEGRPVSVMYLDMEMAEDELAERLKALDFDYPHDQLLHEHLRYSVLQNFAPFSTAKGGSQLMAAVEKHDARLVVIDTFSRVIDGKENESDSYQDFVKHTGNRLRAEGVTVVRLDHLGKNRAKGSRGSSAKRDDVDVNWILGATTRNSSHLTFKRDKGRQVWIPERVDVVRNPGPPVRHELKGERLSEKASMLVQALDELDLPISMGRDRAKEALRDAGVRAGTDPLAEALAHRKRRPGQVSGQGSWTTTGQGSRTRDVDDA